MEKFQARIYNEVNEPSTSKNHKIVYITSIIIISILLGQTLDLIPEKTILDLYLILGIFTIIIVQFSAFFKEEEIQRTLLGEIEITTDGIKWINQKLLWAEIENISISYRDYKGKSNNHFNEFKNKKSAGLDNEIFITTRKGKELSANLLIDYPKKADYLQSILYEVVKTQNIDYENAKRMVHPANYKEHQALKKIIKNRVNSSTLPPS